ncbi:MAG: hypothetical protein M5U23_06290 [Acidimicrobiia bacterium]|nr:hypothetical protein [Acidimicrobiia bacterium]
MTGTVEPDVPSFSLMSRLRIVHALPLVPVFLVGLLASAEIRDNSFLWHVRAGDVQSAAGSVINHDVFSFTSLGMVWRTQSWLVELLYNGINGAGSSLAWVNWMVLVVGVLTIMFIGTALYRSVPSPVVVGFTLIVAVWLLGPFLQPRPVIFSFLALAALVVVLQNRDRVLWLVVPLIWVWAGIHGSWIIGGLLLALEWLRTGDRQVFKVGLVSLVATLATAHGLGTWLVVYEFFGSQDALALMQEWQVPNFGEFAQMPYLILIAGIIVAGIGGKIRVRDLVVVLPFMFFGMTSQRAVVPAAIVLLPWAVMAIPAVRVPKSAVRPIVASGIIVVLALLAIMPMVSDSVGTLDAELFPSAGARSQIHGLNAFYDDGVGGFLIFSEWPERLVWIDDRAELHGVERMKELGEALNGNYEAVFTRYGFEAALTKPDWPLTDRLAADGWEMTYDDGDFLVFVP